MKEPSVSRKRGRWPESEKRPPSLRALAEGIDVSPELEAAVAGGMMADRKQRYETAIEFRERLQAAADA